MVPGSTVKLSANTEAALQAAINIAAPGETIDPAGITISAPLIIPTGTNVIIDGFGEGTGTFGAMQLNMTQPIIIEAGATAVFSYVDVNFKRTLANGADGGDGDAGDAGAAGANGNATSPTTAPESRTSAPSSIVVVPAAVPPESTSRTAPPSMIKLVTT
jgi:hypothetical protein